MNYYFLKSCKYVVAISMLLPLLFFMVTGIYAAEMLTERFGGTAATVDRTGVLKTAWFSYYSGDGNPNSQTLYSGRFPYQVAGGGDRRHAIYIDVSAIPAGTKIVKAEYVMPYDRTIYPFSADDFADGISLYRILDPSGTGMWNPTSIGTRTKDQAKNIPWTTGGTFADCVDPNPVCTVYGIGRGMYGAGSGMKMFHFFDITNLVQEWVNNPQSNLGFTFDRTVPSDKITDPDFRPYLEITYEGTNTNRPQQPNNLAVFHRSGQTFLTWTEIPHAGAFYDMLYRVYRHNQRITKNNLADSVFLGEVTQQSSFNARRSSERILNTPHNYVINNGDQELSDDTGLFVYTTKQNGYFYYAVTAVVEGNENRDEFSAQNSMQSGVSETVDLPEVVVQETEMVGDTVAQQCVFWADDTTSYRPGYGFNFMLNLSPDYDPDKQNYLYVAITGRGASYYSKSAYGEVYIYPDDYMPPTHYSPFEGDGLQTWWSGCRDNYKTQEKFSDGVFIPYTENRILKYIQIAKRRYSVDENRIYLGGFSMGGTGTMSLGLKHPEVFAAIGADHGCPNWRLNIAEIDTSYNVTQEGWRGNANALWGSQSENVLHENGTPIWDWMNAGWYAVDHMGDEAPFLEVTNGRIDGSICYYPIPKFYQDMLNAKRGFAAYFPNNGHSPTGTGPKMKTIVKNESFPALRKVSIDDNPGAVHQPSGMALVAAFGPPLVFDGDISGQINGYTTIQWCRKLFQFSNTSTDDDMVDTTDRYEIALRLENSAPADTATADITPRRLQQFKVQKNYSYDWENVQLSSNTIIQRGNVMPDKYGLITIQSFTITKDTLGNKLKVTRGSQVYVVDDDPDDDNNDTTDDGKLDMNDVQLCINVILGIEQDPDIITKLDINGDQVVNVLDLQLIVNTILGE
ncbi:MAG: prolyl oligopeptidase family serine peptidase [Bacteroidota bacterium]